MMFIRGQEASSCLRRRLISLPPGLTCAVEIMRYDNCNALGHGHFTSVSLILFILASETPGQRFCSLHKQHNSPALTPNQLSKESLASLNQEHSNREKFLMTGLERDNIFVVEGLSNIV